MLLSTHRVAPSESQDCNRLYLRKKTKRSTPLSADELAARARFSAVRAAVKTRSTDLSKMTTDQQAFIEQKNTALGKKTMNAYLWKVCGDEYDAAHPQG